MHRILAAVDLSDCTESVLKFAGDLAQVGNATVSVVYAIQARLPVDAMASSWGMSAVLADEDLEFKSSVGRLHQAASENGLAVSNCLCVRGSAAEIIREAAEQIHADLIVTGSHGHGRLFHAMIGSVRESLLSHAPCPVFVVPNHAKPS